MNISGISGLATKTSYIMFLLKAIQYKCKEDVAIIVMNVKEMIYFIFISRMRLLQTCSAKIGMIWEYLVLRLKM